MSKVVFKNVTKIFEGANSEKVAAVDNLNLEVVSGELLTLLGPSGCGKTTILRMLAGFETPTEGRIFVSDKDVTDVPPNKRGMSMVFQSYGLFPHMSVFHNVAYGLKVRKYSQDKVKEKVMDVLKMIGLENVADRSPRQLSGGQQQRIALARALVIEPKVLLFDEPLSNLDAKLRVLMREEIRKIQQRLKITAVYVTHDQEEAMSISDRIVLLNKGVVEQIGKPSMLYVFPKNRFVANFVGKANFIPTMVESVDRDFVTVKIGNIPLVMPKKREVVLGEKVDIVLRPETIQLGQSYEYRFQGKIEFISYLGSQLVYKINALGQTIVVELQNPKGQINFQPNDPISFSFNEAQLHYV